MKAIEAIAHERLTEQQLQIVATELLAEETDRAAAELFGLLNRHPTEDGIANALELLRSLSRRSAAWRRLLEKSVKKGGRCPKPLRAKLRNLLASEQDHAAVEVRELRDLLGQIETSFEESVGEHQSAGVQMHQRGGFLRPLSRTGRLQITTELTDIMHMEQLAANLAALAPIPDDVILDLQGVEHVYIVGLAALTAWCRRHNRRPQIENAPAATHRYLDEIGFSRAATSEACHYSEANPNYALAIEEIGKTAAEDIASRLVRIIDTHAAISSGARSGLMVLFSELVENIQRHAGAAAQGWACAQVYKRRNKLTICIIDTGIGMADSFNSGTNPTLKQRVAAGESPTYLACKPLLTSKPDRHSGYGLYVASELAVRNGGTFRIYSDREIVTFCRRGWSRKENLSRNVGPWKGTWIAMLLDLDAVLPLGDVYTTLPPLPGVEMEDFFNV